MQSNTKIRVGAGSWRILGPILKAIFIVLLGWILYRHATSAPQGLNWSLAFEATRLQRSWPWLAAAILLMPLNWALETFKWRSFLGAFTLVPFMKSYQAVLAGVAVSLFTPNRVGEYAGRILALDKQAAWGAILSSLLGSLCQWIVLLAAGVPGAFVIANLYSDVEPLLLKSFLALGLGLVAILIFALFNIGVAAGIARLVPWKSIRRKLMQSLVSLRRYEQRSIACALVWAVLRSAVYAAQYYLMLRFFGIGVPLPLAAAGISSIFLAQTSLPLPPLAGLLARGELAMVIWGYFTADTAAILAAAYGLFILNLSLPSLVGAWIILRSNWTKIPAQ